MCGRYSLAYQKTDREYDEYFRQIMEAMPAASARYNIAPQQTAPVVRMVAGTPVCEELRWGFRPNWLDDKNKAQINARSETLFSTRMFRSAARCLVLATGWYEWQKVTGGKRPHAFHLEGDPVFAMAGIWTRWKGAEGKNEGYDNYAIITTAANEVAAPIHNRMPVILTGDAIRAWLENVASEPADIEELKELMQPYNGRDLSAYPVSTYVNSPKNISEKCLEPF